MRLTWASWKGSFLVNCPCSSLHMAARRSQLPPLLATSQLTDTQSVIPTRRTNMDGRPDLATTHGWPGHLPYTAKPMNTHILNEVKRQ